jgi:acyl transferase domain-containing protein
VAVHAALESMAMGRCAAAVAAGANLTLIPDTPAMFQRAGGCWVLGNGGS